MVILPYQYTAGVKKNYENLQDVSYLTWYLHMGLLQWSYAVNYCIEASISIFGCLVSLYSFNTNVNEYNWKQVIVNAKHYSP
jgi:hypothetical protein